MKNKINYTKLKKILNKYFISDISDIIVEYSKRNKIKISVYAVSYNALKFESGLGGLFYAR